MRRPLFVASLVCSALAASCSAPPRDPVAPPSSSANASIRSAQPGTAEMPATLEAYKVSFAKRIVRLSPDTFDEAPPAMLKSIVVLDVTISREGEVSGVSVYRSNGYAALERMALDSVRRAAPFAVPGRVAQVRNGSLNFFETFLFRDDGRFRIRSLVDAER